jgi:hypothetical protein
MNNQDTAAPMTYRDPTTPRVVQVIRSEIRVRGRGEEGSPIRRIVEFFSLDGDLLAEVDCCDENAYRLETRIEKLDATIRADREQIESLQTSLRETLAANRLLTATVRKLNRGRRPRLQKPAKKNKRN